MFVSFVRLLQFIINLLFENAVLRHRTYSLGFTHLSLDPFSICIITMYNFQVIIVNYHFVFLWYIYLIYCFYNLAFWIICDQKLRYLYFKIPSFIFICNQSYFSQNYGFFKYGVFEQLRKSLWMLVCVPLYTQFCKTDVKLTII